MATEGYPRATYQPPVFAEAAAEIVGTCHLKIDLPVWPGDDWMARATVGPEGVALFLYLVPESSDDGTMKGFDDFFEAPSYRLGAAWDRIVAGRHGDDLAGMIRAEARRFLSGHGHGGTID